MDNRSARVIDDMIRLLTEGSSYRRTIKFIMKVYYDFRQSIISLAIGRSFWLMLTRILLTLRCCTLGTDRVKERCSPLRKYQTRERGFRKHKRLFNASAYRADVCLAITHSWNMTPRLLFNLIPVIVFWRSLPARSRSLHANWFDLALRCQTDWSGPDSRREWYGISFPPSCPATVFHPPSLWPVHAHWGLARPETLFGKSPDSPKFKFIMHFPSWQNNEINVNESLFNFSSQIVQTHSELEVTLYESLNATVLHLYRTISLLSFVSR
jgi:hypothetical protein